MVLPVRLATHEDAGPIAAIYNHYVENTVVTFETLPVSIPDMAKRIAMGLPNYPWLVSERNGTVLGYAYATQWKARAAYARSVESTIYVAPDHLGKGVGLPLYRELLEQLGARGFHCALGGIALPNPASVALHEKLGFRKVGELQEVGWKMEQWINVGYWELLLTCA